MLESVDTVIQYERVNRQLIWMDRSTITEILESHGVTYDDSLTDKELRQTLLDNIKSSEISVNALKDR